MTISVPDTEVPVNKVAGADIGGFQHELNRKTSISLNSSALLPQGRCWSEIRDDLVELKRGDYDWRSGRLPIYVYHDDEELLSVSREAYSLYFSENALGRRAFPSLVRMEDEVVRMSLSLLHAPDGAVGSFTSGGTESIFLALKSARDRFRAAHSRERRPNVVVPKTAHPVFDKAAQYLDIDIVRINIGPDFRVEIAALQSAIDDCTMMIVGSAPCYPYGVFDSIPLLAEIALLKGIWLHVDACLGGFLAPFAREEGYPIPQFDFSIPGVTSLSADLHKYGFSARGASVILYRSSMFKKYQGFHFENWPRGTYSTETFLGSRPGGAVASAWAVSQYLGRAGYRRLAKKTMEAKERLIFGIGEIQGIEVLHPSDLSILLYKSVDSRVDINAVGDALGGKGWFVGRTREPEALHLALNAVHAPVVDEYLTDLREAVQQVRSTGKVGDHDETTY
jgi:sphinganine-1-phosphate aldolase